MFLESKDTVYLGSRLLFCFIDSLQSLMSSFVHGAQCSIRPRAVHLLSLTRLLEFRTNSTRNYVV